MAWLHEHDCAPEPAGVKGTCLVVNGKVMCSGAVTS